MADLNQILHEHGFPVPTPIDISRHCIVMTKINAPPLLKIEREDLHDVGKLYSDLMNLLVRLARSGLIHADYNEFNILVDPETGKITLIDFPQMVSVSHENAQMSVLRYQTRKRCANAGQVLRTGCGVHQTILCQALPVRVKCISDV